MSQSLKVDHISGALAAGVAAAILVVAALVWPAQLMVLISLMVCADWIRLVLMIRRHERLLADGGLK
jgi:hypothetical protein